MTITKFCKDNPAIVLSLLSAYGYFCAYFYELGACFYYHIPNYFIDVQLIDVIKFTATITGFVIMTLWYLEGVVFNTNSLLQKSLTIVIFQFNFACLVIIYFINNIINLQSVIYLWLLISILLLNFPFFFAARRHIRSEKRLFNAYKQENPDISEYDLIKMIESETAKKQVINPVRKTLEYVIYIGIAIPAFCAFWGFGSGTKMEGYLFLKGHPNYAIVKKYGDNIICKNITDKNQIGDSILIFKMTTEKQLNGVLRVIKRP